jgi:hypothetical protein
MLSGLFLCFSGEKYTKKDEKRPNIHFSSGEK